MTKSSDAQTSLEDADTARTYRQLSLVKALFRIDDPELERALAVIVDRLAAAAGDDAPSAMAGGSGPGSPHE
ncbi:hypothetical protein [Bradyrhizobium sp.]|uniref:hypothetical protein n=1 Tax=Bradyrhizobium sp. TaxID=376 RepID=UPI003C3F9B7C